MGMPSPWFRCRPKRQRHPVALDSSTITYTPAAGFTGADAMEYAISDGNGFNSTGRIEVLVYPGAVAGVYFHAPVWNNNSPS